MADDPTKGVDPASQALRLIIDDGKAVEPEDRGGGPGGPGGGDSGTPNEKPAVAWSEEQLARRFVQLHGDALRYVSKWEKWREYDGMVWRDDDMNAAMRRVRETMNWLVGEQADVTPTLGRKLQSAATNSSVLKFARSFTGIAASTDQWDRDPMLLNTPAGGVDLNTGKIKPHDPADYCSRITAVAPEPGCPIPLWSEFMYDVTGKDREGARFLQRYAGYCLTGLTQEQTLLFLFGPGGNGKGTFINTLAGIMGDYAAPCPPDFLLAKKNQEHLTEIASLHNRRLATATETDKGRRWDETKLKSLTGSDPLAVRRMREDLWNYLPQFKLVISGNDRPRLRSVDPAITRRFVLVPFLFEFKGDARRLDFAAELRPEWPGILQWMLDGLEMYLEEGLTPPPSIAAATAEYLTGEDTLGQWHAEECTKSEDKFVSLADTFESFRAWSKARGEYEGTARGLMQALIDRFGYRRDRKAGARGVVGLVVRGYERTGDLDLKGEDQ